MVWPARNISGKTSQSWWRQTHQIRSVTGNILASVQQPNYQGITDDLLTDILHNWLTYFSFT
jgi:hypothetical protein